ncbi:hypothetical protein BDR04DRAFT_1119649 [Suillus decipiens]|nr:hypothetical protein BDR04DRAFT_1119649 [Suillus decipiens]
MSTISPSNIRIPTSFPHPPLDANGSNYTSWVTSMDLWLLLFNLWRLITSDEKAYDASADAISFQECQSIIKGLLGMVVYSSDLIHFVGATDPATIWKVLEDKYQASVSICFMTLMGHVFDLPKASNSNSLTKAIEEITDIKLILHSTDANARKLTLEGVISQIRNLEQYYATSGTTATLIWQSQTYPIHSAATAHMESKLSFFTRYRTYKPPLMVKLANDDTILAPGWGFIMLAFDNDGKYESIELPFLHVPDLWCTLISVSTLAAEGIFFEMDAEGGQMHHADRTVIAHAKHTHMAFAARFTQATPLPLLIWHVRMGHAANSTLHKAEKVVVGLSINHLDKSAGPGDYINCIKQVCITGCLYGNQLIGSWDDGLHSGQGRLSQRLYFSSWGKPHQVAIGKCFPVPESLLDCATVQPYMHNCLVTLHEGRHHCHLRANLLLSSINHVFQGDAVVMRIGSGAGSVVNMQSRDNSLADFIMHCYNMKFAVTAG